jgi:hypothetical protein
MKDVALFFLVSLALVMVGTSLVVADQSTNCETKLSIVKKSDWMLYIPEYQVITSDDAEISEVWVSNSDTPHAYIYQVKKVLFYEMK